MHSSSTPTMEMMRYQSLACCCSCASEHLHSSECGQHLPTIHAIFEHLLANLLGSTLLKALFSFVSQLPLFCPPPHAQRPPTRRCSKILRRRLHLNLSQVLFLLLILSFATSAQAALWNDDSWYPGSHIQLLYCHMDPMFVNFPNITNPNIKHTNGRHSAEDLEQNLFSSWIYPTQPNLDSSSDYKWKPWPTLNEPFDAEIPLPSFSSSPPLGEAPGKHQGISPSPGEPALASNLPDHEDSHCPMGNCPFETPAETAFDGGLVSLGLYTNPEEVLASGEPTADNTTLFPEGRGLLLEEAFNPPERMATTISGRDRHLRERNHRRRLREGWASHQLGEEPLEFQRGYQESWGNVIMPMHPPMAAQPLGYAGNAASQPQMQAPFYPEWQAQPTCFIDSTWNQQMQASFHPQQQAQVPRYVDDGWNQHQMQAPSCPQTEPQMPSYVGNDWDQQMQLSFPLQLQSQISGYVDDNWNHQQMQAPYYPQADPQILGHIGSAWDQQQMLNLYTQEPCNYPSFSNFSNMQ